MALVLAERKGPKNCRGRFTLLPWSRSVQIPLLAFSLSPFVEPRHEARDCPPADCRTFVPNVRPRHPKKPPLRLRRPRTPGARHLLARRREKLAGGVLDTRRWVA